MGAIIKRELKNYLKNPFLWIGLVIMLAGLYQILEPYFHIRYFQSEEEVEQAAAHITEENLGDAGVMDGYVVSTVEQQMELGYKEIERWLVEYYESTEEEAKKIVNDLKSRSFSINELSDYMIEKYDFYNADYIMQNYEIHKGTMEEVNSYIEAKLDERPFTYYFSEKFADFTGLFMSFFATILLAFLFMRDTRRDTYELLHTKPVSAACYIGGKAAGGLLVMLLITGFLTVVFGVLCEAYGRRTGFSVHFTDMLRASALYIFPTLLMIVSVYSFVSLLFKNPLPAVPMLLLYMVYSNMGSIGPDGRYGYYGRPLAIIVRFPGRFFEISPPPMVLLNQVFLIAASVLLFALSVALWKRRRVY